MKEVVSYAGTLCIARKDGDDAVMPFRTQLLGRPGFLHGGAIAGFLALTCDSKAEAEGGGHDAATSTMSFLRGGRERDTFARALIRARTARLLVIEATAWQESPDKPIATMSRTYLQRRDG
jgi:acyl-coenzyme A thioesterase PaaI-like protein